MGTQRVQRKGGLPWLVRWARHVDKRDFYPALAALVSQVQNIFLSLPTLFYFLCPHRPTNSGQAVVQGRLSLDVWLRVRRKLIQWNPPSPITHSSVLLVSLMSTAGTNKAGFLRHRQPERVEITNLTLMWESRDTLCTKHSYSWSTETS